MSPQGTPDKRWRREQTNPALCRKEAWQVCEERLENWIWSADNVRKHLELWPRSTQLIIKLFQNVIIYQQPVGRSHGIRPYLLLSSNICITEK